MSNAEVKEWLRRYRDAKTERQRLEAELAEIRESTSGAKAIEYTGMPKGSKTITDLSDTVVIYERLLEQIRRQREKQLAILEEVKTSIDRVESPMERQVLSLRYISLLTWEQVASAAGYSEQRIYQIHGDALQSLRKIREN